MKEKMPVPAILAFSKLREVSPLFLFLRRSFYFLAVRTVGRAENDLQSRSLAYFAQLEKALAITNIGSTSNLP